MRAKKVPEEKAWKKFRAKYCALCVLLGFLLFFVLLGTSILIDSKTRLSGFIVLVIFGTPSTLLIGWLIKNRKKYKTKSIFIGETVKNNLQQASAAAHNLAVDKDTLENLEELRQMLDMENPAELDLEELAAWAEADRQINAEMRKKGELINPDLLDLPERVLSLLWVKNGRCSNFKDTTLPYSHDFGNFRITFKYGADEPSLIDVDLPIEIHNYLPEPLPYFPSYSRMNPRQRFSFLKWLYNVEQPIEIGYVFVYYYALERHLIFGNSELAIQEIIRLRNAHDNLSFKHYSSDAIALFLLTRGKEHISSDLIKYLSPQTRAFFTIFTQDCLNSEDIILNANRIGFKNKRYIQNNYDLFNETLKETLFSEFSENVFCIKQKEISKCTQTFVVSLANISLMPEQRNFFIPDPFSISGLSEKLNNVLVKTHESVKFKLRTQRPKSVKFEEAE
ncbi:MAG: TerB N-terminal domain-containing protein [Oscillospiraceae bacterium]|jgi:hypothetical protein|nr:TerB N-terminal domain-containing protein [Oscillospiraceae bacterium]